jgi:regulator of protease activity HflC (stomatin/prohibitin superfamily)
MEKAPFFRRTLWIFILGLIAVGLPYAFLYLRAAPAGLPGSLLSLVPILGFFSAAGALSLSVRLILQTPKTRNTLPMLLRFFLTSLWLLSHLVYLSEDPRYALTRLIIFDLDLLILTVFLSLSLAAQFVLPVETGQDRLLAIRRLLGYALGERGPVTFVEEGVARQAYAEDQRPGPGVFLIDNTSAVVLRTDTAFTRAMGPGVVFTRPGERCAEALDLRRQMRRVRAELPTDQAQSTEAGVTSQAVTQDGISISAELTITFILDPGHEGSPREGRLADKPPYEFNRTSVERAVYAHTFGEFGDVPWFQLPSLLVADIWREEVKQWSLNDLLRESSKPPQPLEQIRQALQGRLIPPSRKDFQLREDEQEEPSRELEILTSRGIRILEINISDLRLPEAIREERSLRWRETWSGEVQEALQDAIDRVRMAREQGEREADAIIASEIGHTLLDDLRSNKRPDRRDTLLSLISDIWHLTSTEVVPGIDPHLRAKLAALQESLQTLPDDCQEGQG